MKRVKITDEQGNITGWFDNDKATRYAGDAGRDARLHCDLYVTAGRVFLLNHWNVYVGSSESYNRASDKDVAEWVLLNPRGPVEVTDAIQKIIDDMEV